MMTPPHTCATLLLFLLLSWGAFGQRSLSPAKANDETLVARYVARIVKEKRLAELATFCKKLPKGGDLHHHYSGSIYAEDMLKTAASLGLYVDTMTFRISTSTKNGMPAQALFYDVARFEKWLSLFSVLGYDKFGNLPIPSYTHFFNTFGYFPQEVLESYTEQLRTIKQRAVQENVQYIETILLEADGLPIPATLDSKRYDSLLHRASQKRDTTSVQHLLEELFGAMMSLSPTQQTRLRTFASAKGTLLKTIVDSVNDAEFMLRFQLYVFRNIPSAFARFTSALSQFFLADTFPQFVVGVNIVGPEHQPSALQNYWLDMHIFGFLKRKFPKVHTAMHAGELRPGLVSPEMLNDHIEQALSIAKANRIGHGVDIPYEQKCAHLLEYMAKNHIAVEINLTSNAFILGVKGEAHPLHLYLAHQVPVVIATDDAGVLRNDLSGEYMKLIDEHHVDYPTIKQLVRNSILYSFLDEATRKKQLQWLDKRLEDFERELVKTYPLK